MQNEREILDVDALFVGAGPACLAGAIHLARLARAEPSLGELSVAVIEKGREIGSHGISGAVMDPRAARELFPDFDGLADAFGAVPVTDDAVYYLTPEKKYRFPFLPGPLNNHGNLVISLGRFVRWLADRAEEEGVNVFPEFPGSALLYEDDRVVGARTADQGVDRQGQPKRVYQPGVGIRAKITVLGEGPRGALTRALINRHRLDEGRSPQVYSVGIKEVWEAPGASAHEGQVIHTLGYPLPHNVFGGGFLYTMSQNLISAGLVVGLDYQDPRTDPHHEFQLFKLHPMVRSLLDGGKLVSYGAKAIPEGGFFSIPQLFTSGCLIVGDSGSLLNAQRLKGIHTAMKSGMIAAEAMIPALIREDFSAGALSAYEQRLHRSWVGEELHAVRNFHQGFKHGLIPGLVNAGLQMITRGEGLGDASRFEAGHTRMKPIHDYIAEPDRYQGLKYDDTYIHTKLNDVYYSGTMHEEDQPCHLVIADYDVCNTRCREEYGNPCQHFCPANVYEMVAQEEGVTRLRLNPTNCVHCKTCDIMDPYQIITWVTPEGGGGPNYKNL